MPNKTRCPNGCGQFLPMRGPHKCVGTLRERLLANCTPEPNTGCWLWTGNTAPRENGYGQISLKDRPLRAHRAAWEQFRGPIPAGLFVCHRCDVPCCINPDHLFLGTAAQNTADMVAKGRKAMGARARAGSYQTGDAHWSKRTPERVLRGEANPISVLREDDVREMRRLRGVVTATELARRFGVSVATVSGIQLGRRWGHVR